MTKIVLDSELRSKLQGFEDFIELCDEQGRVVGYVTPVPSPYDEYEIPPITREEVEAFRRGPKGRPLQEILSDLERRA